MKWLAITKIGNPQLYPNLLILHSLRGPEASSLRFTRLARLMREYAFPVPMRPRATFLAARRKAGRCGK